MKKSLHILCFIFLAFGCQSNETIDPLAENTELKIMWQNYSDWRNYARVYLYESEEDLKSPTSKAFGSERFKDIIEIDDRYGYETILGSMATFSNLEAKKYWVEIFNLGPNAEFVEINQDPNYTFKYPLIENTITTANVSTKRVYLSSYTINKIEIYDIPRWMPSNNGDKAMLSIVQKQDCCPEKGITDATDLAINNNFITYMPANVKISRLNDSWEDADYYLLLSNTEATGKEYYRLNILQLLNSSARFKDVYVKTNSNGLIQYKLYVSWNK